MEHIKTNDTVCFTANFYHPTSGYSYPADAIPRWLVYKDVATTAMSGNVMTARTDVAGSYVGSFPATLANGFVANSFYDIQVSGTVGGISGLTSVKQFVLDDVVDANIVSVSGQMISPKTMYDANIVMVSGVMVDLSNFAGGTGASAQQVWEYTTRVLTSGILTNANITQVSGVYVSLGDFGGTSSAPTAVAIRQEMDLNSLKLTAISGSVVGLAGAAMRGTDNAATAVSLSALSGTMAGLMWNELMTGHQTAGSTGYALNVASGNLNSAGIWTYATRGLTVAVSVSGIPTVNVVQVSGEAITSADLIDVNVVQVSGVPVDISDFGSSSITIADIYAQASGALIAYDPPTYSELVARTLPSGDYFNSAIDSDIYFAGIRYVSDTTNNKDEYVVHWFKNDQPVASGALTSPSISVYHTLTGAAMVSHKSMSYASSNLGVVRYDVTPMVLASGEPYLVETSGVIDGSLRTWRAIVGIDLL